MRILVFILAILGMLMSGAIAYIWNDESNKLKAQPGVIMTEEFNSLRMATYGLVGAGVLGFGGGFFAMNGKKRFAAPLLLLPSAAPVYFSLSAFEGALVRVLIGCSPLLLAGLLCFLIKTKPKIASAEGEEEKPKRGGKRGRAAVEEVEEPEHAATEEDAEAAYAALEMGGAEAEAPPAKSAEKEADLEAAVAEEEEHVELESAAVAQEEERVDLESAAAPEEETSDHEPAVPAAEDEEAAATLFDEEKKLAAPRRIDKFVCPSCDTFLKASAPLPVGKPFNCPKCREPVTVIARA